MGIFGITTQWTGFYVVAKLLKHGQTEEETRIYAIKRPVGIAGLLLRPDMQRAGQIRCTRGEIQSVPGSPPRSPLSRASGGSFKARCFVALFGITYVDRFGETVLYH